MFSKCLLINFKGCRSWLTQLSTGLLRAVSALWSRAASGFVPVITVDNPLHSWDPLEKTIIQTSFNERRARAPRYLYLIGIFPNQFIPAGWDEGASNRFDTSTRLSHLKANKRPAYRDQECHGPLLRDVPHRGASGHGGT